MGAELHKFELLERQRNLKAGLQHIFLLIYFKNSNSTQGTHISGLYII